MNKSIIAILLLSSAAAFANEVADDQANRSAFTGTLTRGEVQAGIARANAEGTLRLNEYAGNQPQPSGFGRSRTDVRSEGIQAARSHAAHELY